MNKIYNILSASTQYDLQEAINQLMSTNDVELLGGVAVFKTANGYCEYSQAVLINKTLYFND